MGRPMRSWSQAARFLPQLWRQAHGRERDIATRYELSGGTIMNIVRHCCLQAIFRGSSALR